jgi:imidazolonepropionase-like amidohydrolase
MKRRALLACLVTLTSGVASAQPASAGAIVIAGVSVVDPARGVVEPDRYVVIEGGRITAVGGPGVLMPVGVRVVNARGKFLIPGLWDSHVHFMNTGRSALSLYIANGVTSVREMGGFIDSTRGWQREMRAGTLVGPRIITPGMMLETPRYLANVRVRDTALQGRLAPRILPYRVGVADSTTARQAIDSLRTLGVDFVKFRTVASPEALRGILQASHAAGLRVAGHEPGVVSLAAACTLGLDDIEHGFFIPDDSTKRAVLACARSRTVWYTPTLSVSGTVMLSGDSAQSLIFGNASRTQVGRPYASDWLLGWWRMQVDERMQQPEAVRQVFRQRYGEMLPYLREMKDAGFHFLAGTDAGSVLVYPGFSLHDELELLVKDAKLTPAEALYAATVEPATFARMDKQVGRIAAGYAADLVLLDANPLADIRNTRQIQAVVVGGTLFDRAALSALLASVRR